MPASPKRQVQGITSAPPRGRQPQTGGPVMAQQGPLTPRQQQREQYLSSHPNARGNQPPPQPQAPQQGQVRPQQPQQWQPPQGGIQPMPMPGRQPMQQGQFGGQMQDMMYRFPQGQAPDMNQMQGGLRGQQQDMSGNLMQLQRQFGQQQQQNQMGQQPQQAWNNQQMQNQPWQKFRGSY